MKVEITWNDVKSGNPTTSRWVLVTYGSGSVTEAYYFKDKNEYTGRDDFVLETVKAWADMPKAFE
jgi:hypothetical protein